MYLQADLLAGLLIDITLTADWDFHFLKRKYHASLMSFQNPKMFACQQNQKKQLSSFVINYHPSAIKLSTSASGQRQSR